MAKTKHKFIIKKLDFDDNIAEFDLIALIAEEQKYRTPSRKVKTKEELKRLLMYLFWSKAEHEWLVHPWCSEFDKDKLKKVDVYNWSIEPNLDLIYQICLDEKIIKE